MAEKNDYGIQLAGESINWKNIDSERITDNIISALMKDSFKIFIDDAKTSDLNENIKVTKNYSLKLWIKKFNEFLVSNKYSALFNEELNCAKVSKKIDKVKKLSKKDEILEKIKIDNLNKTIQTYLQNLIIENNAIIPFSSNNFIEILLRIVYWTLYLIKKRKTEMDISIYIDCAISLYRVIEKVKKIELENIESVEIVGVFRKLQTPTDQHPEQALLGSVEINEIILKSVELLDKIEEIIKKKTETKSFFSIISDNSNLISNSFLDLNEPRFISLYEEQKNVIYELLNALKHDNSLLLFYKVPPANGKTLISAIISKIIGNFNKTAPKKKTLLYICYNSIVRNEVAKLCITHNVDVKFWLAITKMDKYDGIIKTFLRPYKNCYPDWNKRVMMTEKQKQEQREKNKAKFSENLREQWEFFIKETRPLKYKNNEIHNYDSVELPEMIISDLESAVKILEEFGDMFIPYFDEAFAAASSPITAKILHSLPKISILVSATLAEPEEIPTVINDFKKRHLIEEDPSTSYEQIKVIKSDTQHISCTFIGPDGCIYAPHYSIKTLEEFDNFLILFKKEPLIQRAYSLDVVFAMASKLDSDLDSALKFNQKFKYIGEITHTKLRWYAFEILEFIRNSNLLSFLEKINSEKITKLNYLDVSDILTRNAVYYHTGKTLHIATSDIFNEHLLNIATPFLAGSPKLETIIRDYNRQKEGLEIELKNLKKNGNKDSEDDRNELGRDIMNVQIKWPAEFIINSVSHATKFGTLAKLKHHNCEIFGNIEDTTGLDEIVAKLFISGIGVYQPEEFSNIQMDLFLKNKDRFKFIFSTPSIVYGTNISLSIIDIDKSFSKNATKNTLYQLAGRAGRNGKSNSATVIFRDWEMIDMILQKNIVNIEARQIEENYSKLLE